VIKIAEMKQERAAKIEEGRKVLDVAETEKRALTGDENAKYDAIFSEVCELTSTIERVEKQVEAERSIAESAAKTAEINGGEPNNTEERQALLIEAARSFLMGERLDPRVADEWRALQAGSDTEGGYIMMPEQMANQLIKALDDEVFIRGMATTFQVPNAQSLGAPSLDNDPSDADWTTELQTGSEDSDMSFGKRKLEPHPFAKRIKVSNDLLRSGMMNPEQLVLSRLAYKFGITEEKAFLLGHGAGQPLGLFTASNDGISTGRDISTGNTTTAMTFDGLLEAFYSVKSAYQRNGSWLFHRDGIKQIAKLKDGNNQYIWRASVVEGRPDTIQSRPVFSSEYVPNTFTTGLYVGIYGDFKNYWIADAMDLQIQRLIELYAETNQTGFIGRASADGMPVLEEAFARVTLS
jgi:HK97 family phage major capsid protein